MRTTYAALNVGKQMASQLIPGAAHDISALNALDKEMLLGDIQQEYFQDRSDYKGGDIALNDAKKAIQYVRSKKLTKAGRKAVLSGVAKAGAIAGMATGATLGSIVPVAGTVAGGAVGAVGLGTVANGVGSFADQLKRKTKGLYKIARGTRGEHRTQAAQALLYCSNMLNDADPKSAAATKALHVILGSEYAKVMGENADSMTERVADRLKSN